MTVTNTLDLADLQLIKTSDDGNVSGIAFTLEEHVPGIGYSPLEHVHHKCPGKALRSPD